MAEASQSFESGDSANANELCEEQGWRQINVERVRDGFQSDIHGFDWQVITLEPIWDGFQSNVPGFDWRLINIEPVEDDFQSDTHVSRPQSRFQPSSASSCHEKQYLEGFSNHCKPDQINPEIYNTCEAGFISEHFPDATQKINQEQNDHSELTGVQSDPEWQFINFEPSVQDDYICSKEGSHEQNYLYFDQPGPSTISGPKKHDFPISTTEHTEWKQSNAEQCNLQVSSRGKHCKEELPGPSRIKVHSTILKKSNPDRQTHVDYILSVQSEDLKLIPDSHSKHQDSPDHPPQLSHQLKQSSEKEIQKHVHFEHGSSECDVFNLCDRARMGYTANERYPFTKEITRRLTNEDEKEDVDKSVFLGSTSGGCFSHALRTVKKASENTGTKDVDTKAKSQRNISIVFNKNTSANNSPEENKPKRLNKPAHHEKVNGAQAANQPAVALKSQGSTMHQGKCVKKSLDITKAGVLPTDLESGQLHTEFASKSEDAMNVADPAVMTHKTEEKPLSHTEKMVALFTNLQINQSSPPLQSEKAKKKKQFEGKVADYIHCFDERSSTNTKKEKNPPHRAQQEKETLYIVNIDTPIKSHDSESMHPQTSPKVTKTFELHTQQAHALNTNKQYVDAVLLVLKSVQNILVRMATVANFKMLGCSEIDELLKDPTKTKRKRRPWESVCPKDSGVMLDGLFAYSIAHQVIEQAFKKITELYPVCNQWEQLYSDPEKDFVDRNSVSAILALTAMKDVLRVLEGPVANKMYTSTAVETSDSLTSVSVENISDEKVVLEDKMRESRSVVLDIINHMIMGVTNENVEIYGNITKTDQMLSSSSSKTAQDDILNTELKRMSFELVSRTVREAVTVLIKNKIQSRSDTTCDRTQPLPLNKMDLRTKTTSDTDACIHLPRSTITIENMLQEDCQPVASLVQSISNEIRTLISKLLSRLESAEARENFKLWITDIEKESSTCLFTGVEKASSTASHLVWDKSNLLERKIDLAYCTGKESSPKSLAATKESQTQFKQNTADLVSEQGYYTRPVKSTDNIEVQYNAESPHILFDDIGQPCSTSQENHTQKENCYVTLSTAETDSQQNDSSECQSNESIKCVNSSSQTSDSSIQRLFDMNIEFPRARMASQDQFVDGENSRETFYLDYSTPSALLSMRTSEISREGNVPGNAEFRNVYLVGSSDLVVIPATILHMSGGNHPEHVQQTDQNRPCCSGSPNRRENQHMPEKASSSRSANKAAKVNNKPGCGKTTCHAPCQNQTRPKKFLGNLAKNKQSYSEPKLDFYKRTKVLDCAQVRRQQFYSPDSTTSEWSVLNFYPRRQMSDIAPVDSEDNGIEENEHEVEFYENVQQIESNFYRGYGASHQDDARSETANVPNNEDDPGFLITETDASHQDDVRGEPSSVLNNEDDSGFRITETDASHQDNTRGEPSSVLNNEDKPINLVTELDIFTHTSLKYNHAGSCSEHNKETQTTACIENENIDNSFGEKETNYGIQSTSTDDVSSGTNSLQGNLQLQENTLTLDNKEQLVKYASEHTMNTCHVCDTGKLSNQMHHFRRSSCPQSDSSISSSESKCPKRVLSSDAHPCYLTREGSSIHLDDLVRNSHTDCIHESSEYQTDHQRVHSLASTHSCDTLKTRKGHTTSSHGEKINGDSGNHCQCLGSRVSQSACHKMSIHPADSEFKQNHSCEQMSRNCGCRRRYSWFSDGTSGHRNLNSEPAAAATCGKCASLDSQLEGNNKNINGTGRGIENFGSSTTTSSRTFNTAEQDVTVDPVQDKFLQLQIQLEEGIDDLKDYIVELCSALNNDKVAGAPCAGKTPSSLPMCFSSSSSCASSVRGRMPQGNPACLRDSASTERTTRVCRACRHEHCEHSSAAVSPSGSHHACQSSNSCVKTRQCCRGQRDSRLAARCSGRLSSNCIADNKGACCCRRTGEFVDINACPSHSSNVCSHVQQSACFCCLSDFCIPLSHSSSHDCHRVSERKHCTVPEQPPSNRDGKASPNNRNHYRICRLPKPRSHRVNKDGTCWTTNRIGIPSVSMSMTYPELIKKGNDSNSATCIKEETAYVSQKYVHSATDTHGHQNDSLSASDHCEGTAVQRQTETDVDNMGACGASFLFENTEADTGNGSASNKKYVYRTVDTSHRYHKTRVSSTVVEAAVSIVETLLKMQHSQTADAPMQTEVCHRVGNSSVDCDGHFFEGQMIKQSEGLAKRAESRKCVNSVCRDILDDSVKHTFNHSGSKLTTQETDLCDGSDSVISSSNVCNTEQMCTYHNPRSQDCCSETSVSSHDQRSLDRNMDGDHGSTQVRQHQCAASGKSVKQTVETCTKCPHTFKSNKSLRDKTRNENRSNSNPSKCDTFLVCVGEKEASSALVIQPLAPSRTVQYRDTACQASDESVCASVRRSSPWTELAASEMSIANTYYQTVSGREIVELSDNTHQSTRRYGAVNLDSPTSLSGNGCDNFYSVNDPTSRTRDQSRSITSMQRERAPNLSESRSSSMHILEGICEISHSGCETCQKDSQMQISDAAALSSQCVEKHVTPCAESGATNNACIHDDNVDNIDTEYPLKTTELSELTHTHRIHYTVGRTANCCTGAEHRSSEKSKELTTMRDTAVDPVCQLGSQSMCSSWERDVDKCCALVDNDFGSVDPAFLRENVKSDNIVPGMRCKSSHVDTSFISSEGVYLGVIAKYYGESCVDSSTVDGAPNNIDKNIGMDPSKVTGDKNNQRGVVTEALSELKGSSSTESKNGAFKDIRCNTDNPSSGCYVEFDSAGGDSSTPIDWKHPEAKASPRSSSIPINWNQPEPKASPVTECMEDNRHTDEPGKTDCCMSLPTSQSGFTATGNAQSGFCSQHQHSPRSSVGSFSITAGASSSSVSHPSSSSSPLDPFMSLCSSSASVRLQRSASTSYILDCEASFSALESAQEQRSAGISASGFFAGTWTGGNNSHTNHSIASSASTVVERDPSFLDVDVVNVKRSRSSEHLCSRDKKEWDKTRDTWMSLLLLNLNSRATRLAVESRVQSLQRILSRMENCTNTLPSASLAASEQQPQQQEQQQQLQQEQQKQQQLQEQEQQQQKQRQQQRQQQQHQQQPSLEISRSLTSVVAATSSPGDHWLKACSSEELVQMIQNHLARLKGSADDQGRLLSSSARAASAEEVCENTNTNHESTRGVHTHVTPDTSRMGTVLDVSRLVTFTHCFCTVKKFHVDADAAGSGMKVDYPDLLNAFSHDHVNTSVSFQDNQPVVMHRADSAEGNTHMSRACIINRDSQAVDNPGTVENVLEPPIAAKVVHRSVATDTSDIEADVRNVSECCDASAVVRKCVLFEKSHFKPSTTDFSDVCGVRETSDTGVNAQICNQKAEVVSFSDSVCMNKTHKGVTGHEHDLTTAILQFPDSISNDVQLNDRETSVETPDGIASIENVGDGNNYNARTSDLESFESKGSKSVSHSTGTKFSEVDNELYDDHTREYGVEPCEINVSKNVEELKINSKNGNGKDIFESSINGSLVDVDEGTIHETDTDPIEDTIRKTAMVPSKNNTCMSSFGATFFTNCGGKSQQLNATRNQGVCAVFTKSIEKEFTTTHMRPFSAMVTEDYNRLVSDVEDDTAHYPRPTSDKACTAEIKEEKELPAALRTMAKSGVGDASHQASSPQILASLTKPGQSTEGTKHEVTIKIEVVPYASPSKQRDERECENDVEREDHADRSSHKAERYTYYELHRGENNVSLNTDIKPRITRKKSRKTGLLSRKKSRDKRQSRALQNSTHLLEQTRQGPATEGEVHHLGVRNSSNCRLTNSKSSREGSVASFSTKHAGEGSSPRFTHSSTSRTADDTTKGNPQHQADGSGREFPEDEPNSDADASGQHEVESEERMLMTEECGEVSMSEDDVTGSSLKTDAQASDVGVQCSFSTSSTVQRSKVRDVRDAGNHRDLSGTLETEHVTNRPESKDSPRSSGMDVEEELAECRLGTVVKQYQQRVRSLEQALDLERQLHRITRSSLMHLESDHDRFRQQILQLNSRTRDHSARGYLSESWRDRDE